MEAENKSTNQPYLFDVDKVEPALLPYLPGFYQDRLKDFANMEAFLRTEDFDSLRRMAHSWKGFCSPYGFPKLSDLASDLEIIAQQPNPSLEIKVLLEEIRQFLKGMSEDEFLNGL